MVKAHIYSWRTCCAHTGQSQSWLLVWRERHLDHDPGPCPLAQIPLSTLGWWKLQGNLEEQCLCVLLSRPLNNRQCSEHFNKQSDDRARRGHRRVPQGQRQKKRIGWKKIESLLKLDKNWFTYFTALILFYVEIIWRDKRHLCYSGIHLLVPHI